MSHTPTSSYDISTNPSTTHNSLKGTISSTNKIKAPPTDLKDLKFLSNIKKNAKRIAKNPQRFLDAYADGKIQFRQDDDEDYYIDPLEEMFNKVNYKTKHDYNEKMTKLKQKQELSKKRAFLLNLSSASSSSTSIVSREDSEDEDFNLLRSSDSTEEMLDHLIQKYLNEIKATDLTNISNWISTNLTIDDLQLPCGLPQELDIPFADSLQDETLVDFVESAVDQFILLDGQYHQKIELLQTQLRQNYENIFLWKIEDSSILLHVLTMIEDSPVGPTRNLLLTQLTRKLFPTKSQEEIISQKYLLKLKRTGEEKRDSIIQDWIRDKSELVEKINTAWIDICEHYQKISERRIKIKSQKQKCDYWASLLDQMRRERCEKVKQFQQAIQPFEKSKKENEEILKLEEEIRQQSVKEQAERFKEMKLEQMSESRKVQEELSIRANELSKVQSVVNKSRIKYRRDELEIKKQAMKEAEKEIQQEKTRRAKLLEETKGKVSIDYDPLSILSDTHASLVRQHEIQSRWENAEEESNIKFFQERYSFSSETIMKDRRVRLESKLRDAGLIESSYARTVLLAMEPQHKPHLHSQIKIQDAQ